MFLVITAICSLSISQTCVDCSITAPFKDALRGFQFVLIWQPCGQKEQRVFTHFQKANWFSFLSSLNLCVMPSFGEDRTVDRAGNRESVRCLLNDYSHCTWGSQLRHQLKPALSIIEFLTVNICWGTLKEKAFLAVNHFVRHLPSCSSFRL